MRAFCRTVLVSLLVVSLADWPAATAANRALGFVLAAQSSQINGIGASSGTNVFAGDALSTGPDGIVHLQSGTDQIYMPASSAITLASAHDGLMAVLSTGTLSFSAPQGAGLSICATDVIIRPKTPQLTQGQVTVLAPDELKIASVSGALELQLDGESYALAPGHVYGVKIIEEGGQEQNAEHRPARRRRRRLLIFLLFGAAAAVALVAVVDLHKHHHVSQYTP